MAFLYVMINSDPLDALIIAPLCADTKYCTCIFLKYVYTIKRIEVHTL